jgi:hypothetical protein
MLISVTSDRKVNADGISWPIRLWDIQEIRVGLHRGAGSLGRSIDPIVTYFAPLSFFLSFSLSLSFQGYERGRLKKKGKP